MSWNQNHRPYDHRRNRNDRRNNFDHRGPGMDRVPRNTLFGPICNNNSPGLLGERPIDWPPVDRRNSDYSAFDSPNQHYEDRRHGFDMERSRYGQHNRSETSHSSAHYVPSSSDSPNFSNHHQSTSSDSRNFTRTGDRHERERHLSSSRYQRDSSRDGSDSYSHSHNFSKSRSSSNHHDSQYDSESRNSRRTTSRDRDRDDYSSRYKESQSRDENRREKVDRRYDYELDRERRSDVDRVSRHPEVEPVSRRGEDGQVSRRFGSMEDRYSADGGHLIWETPNLDRDLDERENFSRSQSRTRDENPWDSTSDDHGNKIDSNSKRHEFIKTFVPYVRWLTTWRDYVMNFKDYSTDEHKRLTYMSDLKAVEWLLRTYDTLCDFSREITYEVVLVAMDTCKHVVLRHPSHTEWLKRQDEERDILEQESARSPSPPAPVSSGFNQQFSLRKDFVNITRVIPTERSTTSDLTTNNVLLPQSSERTIDWDNSRITIKQEPRDDYEFNTVSVPPPDLPVNFEDQFERRKPKPQTPVQNKVPVANDNINFLDWFTRKEPKREQFEDRDMRGETSSTQTRSFSLDKENHVNPVNHLSGRSNDEDLRTNLYDVPSSPVDYLNRPRSPPNIPLTQSDIVQTTQNQATNNFDSPGCLPPMMPPPYPPIPPPIPPTFANQPMFNPFIPQVPVPPMPPVLNMPNQQQLMMGYPNQRVPLLPTPQMMPPNNFNPFTPVHGQQQLGMPGNMGHGHVDLNSQRMPQMCRWGELSEEDIMISKIKEKAAESFARRGKDTSRPHFSHNQGLPEKDTSLVLDPRLKPRVPRDIQSDIPSNPVPVLDPRTISRALEVKDPRTQTPRVPEVKDPRTPTPRTSELDDHRNIANETKSNLADEVNNPPKDDLGKGLPCLNSLTAKIAAKRAKLKEASELKQSRVDEIRRDVETVLHPLGSKGKNKTTVGADVVDKLVHASDSCKNKRSSRQRTSFSSEEGGKSEEVQENNIVEENGQGSNLRRSSRKSTNTNEPPRESPERRSPRSKANSIKDDAMQQEKQNFEDNVSNTSSQEGKNPDQRPGLSTNFRIPKIKRPDPPPPPIISEPEVVEIPSTSTEDLEPGSTSQDEILDAEVSSSSGARQEQVSEVEKDQESKTEEKPNLSDEFFRNLLIQTLGPEQADILQRGWDNVKAEVTAVIQNKLAGINNSSLVQDEQEPASTTSPDSDKLRTRRLSSESREGEEVQDESSRGRSVKKRKSGKRRSSLEKLHEALREMDFDKKMPLGPRRVTIKQPEEEEPKPEPQVVTQKDDMSIVQPIQVLCSKVEITQENGLIQGVCEGKKYPIKRKSGRAKYFGRRRKKKHLPGNLDLKPTTDSENLNSNSPSKLSPTSEPKKKKIKRKLNLSQESDQQRRVTRSQVVTSQPEDIIGDAPDPLVELNVAEPTFNESLNSNTSSTSEEALPFPEITEKVLQHSLKPVRLGKDFELPMKDLDQIQLQPEDYDIGISMTADDLDLNSGDFELGDLGTNFMGRDEGLDQLLPPSLLPQENYQDNSTDNQSNIPTEAMASNRDPTPPPKKRKVETGESCSICDYFGKRIIAHYSNNHPGTTIPQSCLSSEIYESLIEINSSKTDQVMEIQFSKLTEGDDKIFLCLFCDDRFAHMFEYFEHLSSHTGEFRYMCKVCGMKYAFESTAINHVKSHKKIPSVAETIVCLYEPPVASDTEELSGYLCKQCNYFQLEVEHVSHHLEDEQHDPDGVVCIKFQGPAYECSPVTPRFDESVFLGTDTYNLEKDLDIIDNITKDFKDQNSSGPSEQRFYDDWLNNSPSSGSSVSSQGIFETDDDIKVAAVSAVDWLVEMVSLEETGEVGTLIHGLKFSEIPGPSNAAANGRNYKTFNTNLQRILESSENKKSLEESRQKLTEIDDDGSTSGDSTDSEEVNDFFEDSDLDLEIPLDLDYPEEKPETTNEINASNTVKLNEVEPMEVKEHSEPVYSPASRRLSASESEQLGESMDNSLEPSTLDTDRITNLEGPDLYRCGNENCSNSFADELSFRDHASSCHAFDFRNSFVCHHCDKKFRAVPNLMDHIKVHGKRRQVCSLCNFRSWVNYDMNKHMKAEHKVFTTKMVKAVTGDSDPDIVSYPKDMLSKPLDFIQLKENHGLYIPKVQYLPNEVDNIPKQCVFSSALNCAKCDYSTKVRTNFIRHMKLHEEAEADGGETQVPADAPVNPAPCLTREGLMFDKMINLAGSSHMTKNESGSSRCDGSKVPQFVSEQFRYVCSVANCKQITVDDSLLRTHMKVFHPEVTLYKCPHCQSHEETKDKPRHLVPVDRISTHLKLHGSKLFKCGHCEFISIQKKLMDKHVADKHVEKKQIHFLIRDLDKNGKGSDRRNSTDENSKSSEKWRCLLCRNLFGSWADVSYHCIHMHKVHGQFLCSLCRYSTNSIFEISNHLTEKVCSDLKEPSILPLFARNETTVQDDSVTSNIWRKNAPRVKHIRGIYLEEEQEENESEKTEVPLPRILNPQPSKNVFLKTKPSTSNKVKFSATKTPQTNQPIVQKPNTSHNSSSNLSLNNKQFRPITSPLKNSGPFVILADADESGTPYATCPLCGKYKTVKRECMKIHLYNELKYLPYTCRMCGNRCVTINSLKAHVELDHQGVFCERTHLSLAFQDPEVENRVEKILRCEFDVVYNPEAGKPYKARKAAKRASEQKITHSVPSKMNTSAVAAKPPQHTSNQVNLVPPNIMQSMKTYLPSPRLSQPSFPEKPQEHDDDVVEIIHLD